MGKVSEMNRSEKSSSIDRSSVGVRSFQSCVCLSFCPSVQLRIGNIGMNRRSRRRILDPWLRSWQGFLLAQTSFVCMTWRARDMYAGSQISSSEPQSRSDEQLSEVFKKRKMCVHWFLFHLIIRTNQNGRKKKHQASKQQNKTITNTKSQRATTKKKKKRLGKGRTRTDPW